MDTPAKTFFIPVRQNQFSQENIFENAQVRRIDIAMNKKPAFPELHTENPFWNHQCDLRLIRRQSGGQPLVDSDAADKCRLNVKTLKAMNFHKDIQPIPNKTFNDHCTSV